MTRLVAYYDEHCRLCRTLRAWTERLAKRSAIVEWRHYEQAAACGLDGYACGEALHVQTADDRVYRGFAAVRLLFGCTRLSFLLPLLHLPGMEKAGERLYAWVARHRHRL